MSVNPYLFFSGDCTEAFHRYQEVLGGDLHVITFAEVPDPEAIPPGADPSHVMHAALKLGGDLLMGSDDPTGDDGPKKGMAVSYTAPDVEAARRVFDGLAEGGEIQMPFGPTFWAPGFGGCVDRFGISWLVDSEGEPA